MIPVQEPKGPGKLFMPTQQLQGVRNLESPEEFFEARLEAVGFIFHGAATNANGKTHAARSPVNLLHFARCAKLEKVGENETKIWFRTVRLAMRHLDETIGKKRWRWCKVCEREITQRILDEV
jgi:hypothetical protein